MFSYDDHGVKRLVYSVANFHELEELLQQVEGNEYVLEFLSRDKDEKRKILERAGFSILARMKRVSNPDCRPVFTDPSMTAYADFDFGREALLEEAQEINQILWSVFDTRVSHLSSDEELQFAICKGKISIYRGISGSIDAILQAEIQPRKFYINQVYNKADKSVIHKMMLRKLKDYIDAGGRYMYAWVEENNIASLRFHSKYGMSHDGMWNMVYELGVKR